MKTWGIMVLALMVALAGSLVPGTAWAWGIGWWGPGVFLGGLALGSALAYPYYAYPYYAAPYAYPYAYSVPPVYAQNPTPPAPLVQRETCYVNGCYHLYGDGITQPWQWVWTPIASAPPPAPSKP